MNSSQFEPPNISWTNEFNRIIHSEDHPLREPLSSITIQYLYVSKQNSVVHSLAETHFFPEGRSLFQEITPETLLYWIQSKKQHDGIRYKCTNVLSYFINIEPSELHNFSKGVLNSVPSFLREESILSSIMCPPCIFIFHSLHRIYFIFREMIPVQSVVESIPHDLPLSTDLPTSSDVLSKKTSTKKVRISPEAILYSERDRTELYTHRSKTAKLRK
jgi:hypothetical protein